MPITQTTNLLRVGDTVLWRGNFGADGPRPAKVTEIEITAQPHEKYGSPVDEVDWSIVRADRANITLDNGHWAYGNQIESA